MKRRRWRLPGFATGLSARLLVLTMVFVMLSEVLIFVPSIARFRLTFLEERIAAAHLATLALKATPDRTVSSELENELLRKAMVRGIVLKDDTRRTLMLSEQMPPQVHATFDLRGAKPPTLIWDAFMTLASPGRVIRVLHALPDNGDGYVEVLMDERPMRAAMFQYATNILNLSIVISVLTASLVYLSLQWLMVRPMRRLTESMVEFREAPEDPASVIKLDRRADELGTARRELHRMQRQVRTALTQKTRLAALGAAIGKVNHDLRNILATAQLVSDRLAASDDPDVQRVTPRLIQSIDRAIDLCTRTLSVGRAEEQDVRRATFPLAALVDEVGVALGLNQPTGVAWQHGIDAHLTLDADRDQMYRVLLNLGRNAAEALRGQGEIEIRCEASRDGHAIEVRDNGPGLPDQARENLFQPFAGSARSGGTGLGLVIARDLVRAHGGDLRLVRSDRDGTTFRIELPRPGAVEDAA